VVTGVDHVDKFYANRVVCVAVLRDQRILVSYRVCVEETSVHPLVISKPLTVIFFEIYREKGAGKLVKDRTPVLPEPWNAMTAFSQ